MNKGFAKSVLEEIGVGVAIGYGVFFILAMFASMVSAGGFADESVTLADLLSGNVAMAALRDSSGKGSFLVLLATATLTVPYFWKHRFTPLAFAVPLLFTIYGLWPLYEQHRAQQQAMEAMGELGQAMGQMAEQMGGSTGSVFDSLGVGAWLLLATVVFLALKGVMRFLARA